MNKKAILVFLIIAFLVTPSVISINSSISAQSPTLILGEHTGLMNVTCYSSPDSSYQVLTRYLNSAKQEIDVMIYAISHYNLIKILNDTMDRDPAIKINIIASDQHASASETTNTRSALWQLSRKANETSANLHLYWSNSSKYDYTHAKFVIIDNKTVLVQSANWAKTGVPRLTSYGNREWGVVITDQNVVNEFIDVFYSDLIISEPTYGTFYSSFSPSASSGSYTVNFPAETFNAYMKITPVFSPENSLDAILQLINSATRTLEIQQAYINLYWGDGETINPLVEAVVNAAKRGVSVRIIVEEPTTSSKNDSVNYFLNNSIPVAFSNKTLFEFCHNKGVIVDGVKVLISSINWSYESLTQNREAGVIIESEEVAQFYLEIFNYDWSVAEQLLSSSNIPIEYIGIGSIIVVVIAVIAVFLKKPRK
ncbi:MAG: phospholipase D-like domain-containing protein [Candidatus Odinarchaeum yellowstonii]|uniref:Phospholipase D-like domain-containing protein n=1 Tax=Odinarchaeota yellowstonii (strain LCB_4) TaxID=1841599 RepID=A0AAF0IAQ0_ODILC|nr:MAG: phospholipase D-like domain-containing protein [Candidatus Odinarchaeum yellowstonii]